MNIAPTAITALCIGVIKYCYLLIVTLGCFGSKSLYIFHLINVIGKFIMERISRKYVIIIF